MNTPSLTAAVVTIVLLGIMLAGAVNFDNFPAGTAPPGWTATKTGTGDAKWTVEKDDTAPSKPNVLKQSGQATYPVCIKDDTSLKDGFVEVKFKADFGSRGSGGRAGLAREGFEQLLRGPRECSRGQRHDLPHHQRASHGEEPREHEGGGESMAHACELNSRARISP